MTERELRLRTRIDTLVDRDQEKAQIIARLEREVRKLRRRGGMRCVYCGVPTRCSRACPSHRDLLTLEFTCSA